MPSEIITAIATEVAKEVSNALVKKVTEAGAQEADIQESIAKHLTWVSGWADQIQLYGMSTAASVEDTTVPLNVASIPRRFRAPDAGFTKLAEIFLLESPPNFLVLGDPGSGKTTTLKRLAKRLLTQPPSNTKEIPQPSNCHGSFTFHLNLNSG
jgi:predicted NACHT family NTPase